ncbi:MAG: UBP-type zinc finger domain-containing protein [Haliscomenobacter sp.]|nr:UBP-type zinc finger domain-containing protein [Haliscomenobacter sp.]MBK9491026.1 UBP-type zinc finger domain-containing protein [Haliscomenobacter sp.]
MPETCTHLPKLEDLKRATAYECVECVKTGSHWMHLRTCQTCGETHCCDSSPNKHATKHYHATEHPVISSAEPGENWLWCYADELFYPYTL